MDSPLKLLVIDNDAGTRELLEKVILKEGYAILQAEDGKTGIEIYKKEKPDIVICGLRLPDIDGLEVIRIIRKQSIFIPIIIITAFNETDTAISALHEGVLDYLKKPIDMNSLSITMERAKEKIIKLRKMGSFPNLLITDDEVSTRKRLARELEKEGWTVFQASDGEEALTVFKQNKIDVVLLDIKMPKKDGLQTLHEMRQMTEDFEAIILTGYGDETSAVKAMRNGAINFLKKPIDLEQMISAVEKAIEKRRIDRSLTYRARELELAREIITKIKGDKEIVIDISGQEKSQAMEFARAMIDAVPMGLIIADKALNIRYMNQYMQENFTAPQEKIDDVFIKNIEKAGLKDLPFSIIAEAVEKQLNAPKGTIGNVNTGKGSYITLTSLTILTKDVKENVVLMFFREKETGR